MTLYVGDQLITPTIPGSGGGSPVQKYGLSINSFIGNVSNGTLNAPVMETSNIVFNGVTDLGDNALKYVFNGKTITSASFPNLTTVSGTEALLDAFARTSISSISFPNLTSITGNRSFCDLCNICSSLTSINFLNLVSISGTDVFSSAFYNTPITSIPFNSLVSIYGTNCMNYCFGSCFSLTNVSFDSLESIEGSKACSSMFSDCQHLERIDFPELVTIDEDAFGIEQWEYIFNNCWSLTEIHFRADMQSTITNMYGYADKWGAENATIYFDLSACSVSFSVTPSENTIKYLDNKLVSSNTTSTGTGDHTYTLINSNYPIYRGNIYNMEAGDSETITKDLTLYTGKKVTINTNVENCTVVFNYNGYTQNATTITSTSYNSKDVYAETSMVIGYTVSKTDYTTVSGTVTISNQDVSINVTLRTNDVDLTNYNYTMDENDNAVLTEYIGPDVTTLVLPNL